MRATHRITRSRAHDDGSLTVFVVIVFVGLMMFAGIVADGGAALDAKVHALHAASEAARMGAQEMDLLTYHRTGRRVLDPGDADAAARRFLTSVNAEGTVTATTDSVTVHAMTRHETWLLSLVGIDTLTMTADATAKPETAAP
jgi:hypothetical protein